MTQGRDLTPVAQKLSRLIPRLASNHDGEVVGTVRAIQRVLNAASLDLHDVAAAIACRVPAARPVPAATTGWRRQIERLLQHPNRLTSWEHGFLRSISCRTRLSPKQFASLKNILEAHARRGA
jgi:hypothetical protein